MRKVGDWHLQINGPKRIRGKEFTLPVYIYYGPYASVSLMIAYEKYIIFLYEGETE